MSTFGAKLGVGRNLGSAVATRGSQGGGALLAKPRSRSVLVLARWAVHRRPDLTRASGSYRLPRMSRGLGAWLQSRWPTSARRSAVWYRTMPSGQAYGIVPRSHKATGARRDLPVTVAGHGRVGALARTRP